MRAVTPGESLPERAWWAYQCLPRDASGKPPASTKLDVDHGLGRGTLLRLFKGERTPGGDTMVRVARALGVSVGWLLAGEGAAPKPSGPLAPRPGAPVETVVEKVARYDALRRMVASWRARFPTRAEWLDGQLLHAALSSAEDRSEAEWNRWLTEAWAAERGKDVGRHVVDESQVEAEERAERERREQELGGGAKPRARRR